MKHMPPNPDRRRKADPGKEVEKAVQDWLESRSNAVARFAYHRYPDARSARGALAPQPADFLVSQMRDEPFPHGSVTHLEAKDTQQTTRLPKSKIGQYGKLLMFWMAGIQVRVVIRRSTLGDWVCLTEAELFSHEECPASFSMKDLKSYPTHQALLEDIFK